MRDFFEKKYWIVFIFTTALIFFPTWKSGYLFFLDWNVNPNLSLNHFDIWKDSLGDFLYLLMGTIFPFGMLQKLILFFLIYFLGIGGWKLASIIAKSKENVDGNFWAKYFAGFFMIFNPFVYGRLSVGQFGVVLSVLFILFFVIYLTKALENKKNALLFSGIFSALAVMFLVHSIFFILVVAVVFLIFNSLRTGKYKKNIQRMAVILLTTIILNINVVVGFLLNKNSNLAIIHNFSQEHLDAFKSVGHESISVYFNTLSLHGFWGEGESHFISTQSHNFIWKPVFLLIFSMIIYGIIIGIKRKNKNVIPLLILAITSFVLAVGIAEAPTKNISQFLYDNLPFYIGLREPQKWVGVLLISYVGLGSLGIQHFLELKEVRKNITAWGVGIIFIVLIYTPTMFFGFLGQLESVDFSQNWYEMRSYLDNKTKNKILFLPWHQYLEVDFLKSKEIINPARSFFGNRIIQGDNMEAATVFSQSKNKDSEIIEGYILSKGKINEKEFISDMENLEIRYIILLKAGDFNFYKWLDKIKLLTIMKENESFVLYKIK